MIYFVFANKAQDEVSSEINNPLITSPVSPVFPVSPATPNEWSDEEQEAINSQDIKPLLDSERRQYEEQIHALKLTNSEISNTNNIITTRYNEAVRLRDGAKEDLRAEINENLQLRWEIRQCLEEKRTPEQERLEEAGRKILEICERTATPECLRLFF